MQKFLTNLVKWRLNILSENELLTNKKYLQNQSTRLFQAHQVRSVSPYNTLLTFLF